MSTSYDLSKIRAAMSTQKTATSKGQFQKNAPLKYFKPTIGTHDIRFLPYMSSEGHPIQEVHYYEKISPDGKRLVAPFFFGLPDPIRDIFEEKRKEKDGWAIAKTMKAKDRYYAVIIDRAHEEEGPMLWEFSKDVQQAFYTIMLSKDYAEDNILDPDTGYDFELNVTQVIENGKARTFNGSPVKKLALSIRRRPSPLSPDKAKAEKWVQDIPKLEEMFKRQASSKTPEELIEMLENFVAKLEMEAEKNLADQAEPVEASAAPTSKTPTPRAAPAAKKKEVEVLSDTDEDDEVLDKAFSDI